MNELIYASAKTIAETIRRKEVSSREIITACLERIKQVNSKLNAVVCLDEESALINAQEADDSLAAGWRSDCFQPMA